MTTDLPCQRSVNRISMSTLSAYPPGIDCSDCIRCDRRVRLEELEAAHAALRVSVATACAHLRANQVARAERVLDAALAQCR